jgi:hypothetical protein
MNLRTLVSARPRAAHRAAAHRAAARRPALFIGVATAGALMVNVLSAGEPAAQADAEPTSVSVAAKLGISDAQSHAAIESDDRLLDELSASRSQREADQDAAAAAQAAAEQAAADEAARVAAEQAAAAAAAAAAQAEAAAARPGQGTAAAVAPAGSYQDYAMGKLGGDGSQFSCLENLWGKESGWNPNAQNPSSTAYGIAQFLDSTWAGTGIAKTSDGYRQIDAGLIYIEKAYGSPCDAWAHSQSTGWY